MSPLQELVVRASEIRGRMAELGAVTEQTDETMKEVDSLRSEYAKNEARQRALTIAGDELPVPIETRDAPEGRELRRLLARANLGTMLGNIAHLRAQDGAEKELAEHYDLAPNQIPIALLRDWQQPLETRAVTPAPTDVGQSQMEVLDYVFNTSVSAYLGVDMPTVPTGDTVYPVLETSPTVAAVDEGVTVPETTGSFQSYMLEPKRLQASYFFSREALARFSQMESSLRESLSMGIMDGLDAQNIIGVNGLLGTNGLTLRSGDAAAVATFATYRGLLYDAMTIDGRYAGNATDIRIVVGPAVNAQGGGVYRSANSDYSAIENLMMQSGGVRVSNHIPAPVSNDQDVIVRKGMRRAFVSPVWQGLDIIRDEVTRADTGEVKITAYALYANRLLRADDFQRRAIQIA